MKYVISRASLMAYDDEEVAKNKPVEEATYEQVLYVDQRCVHKVEDNKHIRDEGWYNFGLNHGSNKTGIFRHIPEMNWVVEFDTLEDLNDFINKYSTVIIYPANHPNRYTIPSIKIYDDYIE